MGVLTLPTAATPVERVLSRFDRAELAGFIAVALDLLDLADGDPDVEPNGDEHDVSVVDFNNREPTYKLAEHRDADAYLAGIPEDAEDEDPRENDDPAEDDDAAEDEDNDLAVDDRGECGTAVECVDQTDWAGASLAHGDGVRHEDEENGAPCEWSGELDGREREDVL